MYLTICNIDFAFNGVPVITKDTLLVNSKMNSLVLPKIFGRILVSALDTIDFMTLKTIESFLK